MDYLSICIRLIATCYIGLLCLISAPLQAAESLKYPESQIISVVGNFNEVKEDLVRSIESKGIVISYIAHASDMLNRTADTLKIKQKVYHRAEIILFCKSDVSHKLTQENPHNLILCPYPIAIYSLINKPKIIYLAIRKPIVENAAYKEIHQLLSEIIDKTIAF